MPWCPKCRRFQEDDDLCAYCWVETVEELEPLIEVPPDEEQDTFLLTVSDENEANIVQSLLKVNNIPSLRKHRGSGGYLQIYMGTSNLGIDIFVLEKHLEQAKEILLSHNDSSDNEKNEPDEGISGDFTGKNPISVRRRNRMVIILAIFFILNLIIIILLSTVGDVSFG